MCTVVTLRRPGHRWPLILAANRDEMADRPWRPPARHWPDRPEVVGGLDELAGGSWLALNDHGVVAAALNRVGSLGPAAGMRSRGELVLEAVDHADAADAAAALAALETGSYRPFNLLVADDRDAFWIAHRGGRAPVAVTPVPAGVSMLTAHDLDDPAAPRVARFLPRFRAAPQPDPEAGDWAAWEALLAARDHGADSGPGGAMAIVGPGGFGTTSSALVALPLHPSPERPAVWRFAAGRPGEAPFRPVALRGTAGHHDC